jgi:hypothetical protein
MSNPNLLTPPHILCTLQTMDTYDVPMDPRRLRYFVVAVEQLNLTQPAERLHIARLPPHPSCFQLPLPVAGASKPPKIIRGIAHTEYSA